MIVTFYSYKGGVGRSMALANVAEWYRQRGLRAVMVDWDLEAPGLETFFAADNDARAAVRARLGLVDLLQTYRELFPGLARPTPESGADASAAEWQRAFVDMLSDALPPLRHMLAPLHAPEGSGLPPLWLLTAGNRSPEHFDSYAETVQQFDWTAFYAHFEGEAFFEWMRRQLLDPGLADVVLIDSRTGVTEMSGVCTRQLADVVVMMCAPNDQNLDGVEKMARSFTRSELSAARAGDPLQLLMVPSRLDVSEGRPIDLFEARFRARLDSFLPATLRAAGADFLKLRIPYISAYAFDERLAVGDPQGVKALQQAYGDLATHLAMLAPAGGALRSRCAAALRERFGLPAVIVLALGPEQETAAAQWRNALAGDDLIVLPAPADSAAALAMVAEIGAVQRQGLSLVAVTDQTRAHEPALRSVRVRMRELGVPMLELGDPRLAPSAALEEFRRILRSPALVQRVPVLAPPPGRPLIGRTGELQLLRRLLTKPEDVRVSTIAIVAPGGAGKTALTRTIASDDAVIDHFNGGVLWLTLGGRPDLAAGLAKLVAAYEGTAPQAADIDELQRRLAEAMRGRRCLLVVEDLQTAADLEAVPRGGPGSIVVVTTRSIELAGAVADQVVELGGLPADEARALLLEGWGEAIAPGPADALVRALGCMPLAVQAANGLLKARVRGKANLSAAVEDLLRRLQTEGLAVLDGPYYRDPSSSFSTLMAETEALRAGDRQILHRLAALTSPQAFDLAAAAAALGLPEGEAANMLGRLKTIGWLSESSGGYALQPLAHAAITSLARQEQAQQNRTRHRPRAGLRLYLSYRRRDTGAQADRVHAWLAEQFGAEAVFYDRLDLDIGADWNDALSRAVEEASVVIALIGPRWLPEKHAADDDMVVVELAAAFARAKPVLPVLMSGAPMPPASELPPQIASLARLNALQVDERRFSLDMDELAAAVQRIAASQPAAPALSPSALAAATGGLLGRLVSFIASLVRRS